MAVYLPIFFAVGAHARHPSPPAADSFPLFATDGWDSAFGTSNPTSRAVAVPALVATGPAIDVLTLSQRPPAQAVATAPPRPTSSAPAPARVIVVQQPAPSSSQTQARPRGTYNGPGAPYVRIDGLSPSQPEAGQELQVSAVGGDPDGIIRGYGVDWGDGSGSTTPVSDRCGGATNDSDRPLGGLAHTYKQSGTYRITVIVYTRGTCDLGPTQVAQASDDVSVTPAVPVLGSQPLGQTVLP